MSYYLVDCVNCKAQTMIDMDKIGDTCQFCGKDARKKEEIMEVTKNYQDMNIPERGRYIKEHLAEIVEDMQTLDDVSVKAKWGFKKTTCYVLRKKHAPDTFSKPKVAKVEKASIEKPEEKPAPDGTAPLTEHEQYLVLLGYQQATREFLKYLTKYEERGKLYYPIGVW